MPKNQELNIDASGQAIGRVATQAAFHLRGKTLPTFTPNQLPATKVNIVNAAKIKITTKKLKETEYPNYTGYPGGLHYHSLETVAKKHGYSELCRRAILRMLPRNKLRPQIMKNLTISE